MTYSAQCAAAARLDFAEVLRSRWLLFCGSVYALLAGVLVLVGMRESTMLGFTGVGRVLLAFSHGLVLVLPLLALTATGTVVNRARDDGSLELLLTQPIRRSAWLVGVTFTRFAVLIVPLALLFIAMGLIGQLEGQQIPWAYLFRVLGVAAALIWAFVGIGMAISVFVRSQARATTYVILAWGLAIALLDVGLVSMMLRWRLDPHAVFSLAALNPVQDARLALLSSLERDLGTLGPVGFYLSTRIGHGSLYLLGVAWPALLGTLAWCAGLIGFRRCDIT